MKYIARIAPALVLAFASVAHAAASVSVSASFGKSSSSCAGGTICTVATTLLYLINAVAVPVLFAIAFIVFIWGIVRYFFIGVGDPENRAAGRQLIVWGIIGFVVIISLWGIVNVVGATFGLTGVSAPPTPTSY